LTLLGAGIGTAAWAGNTGKPAGHAQNCGVFCWIHCLSA
jgi:hypothetical protein